MYLHLKLVALVFANFSDVKKFCNNADVLTLHADSLGHLGDISLRCSFFIFCFRHKTWPANIADPIV